MHFKSPSWEPRATYFCCLQTGVGAQRLSIGWACWVHFCSHEGPAEMCGVHVWAPTVCLVCSRLDLIHASYVRPCKVSAF